MTQDYPPKGTFEGEESDWEGDLYKDAKLNKVLNSNSFDTKVRFLLISLSLYIGVCNYNCNDVSTMNGSHLTISCRMIQ